MGHTMLKQDSAKVDAIHYDKSTLFKFCINAMCLLRCVLQFHCGREVFLSELTLLCGAEKVRFCV